MQLLAASWGALRRDRNFMLLAVIAGLFGMSITLFPHYQRLGRERFDLDLTALDSVGAGSKCRRGFV